MSRITGATIDGIEHIQQSVADILGTPIGSRVGRRDYGSHNADLIDQPLTPANILRLFASTALALARWEDRIRLRRVTLEAGSQPGAAVLTIEAERTDIPSANSAVRFSFPLT